jgi:hypothetical protein
MSQSRSDPGLSQKQVGINAPVERMPRNLDGHRSLQVSVVRPPDGPEPAGADFLEQLIMANDIAGPCNRLGIGRLVCLDSLVRRLERIASGCFE